MDKASKKVIFTEFSNGKKHDFQLFKDSKAKIHPEIKVLADSGYQGLTKLHAMAKTPIKKSKNKPLTKIDKESNRQLAKDRILNENVIGILKRFKILSDRYRNRRKRFALRFNLISGIYNWEVAA